MTPRPPPAPDASPLRQALHAIEVLEDRLEDQRKSSTEPIAIIGLGCRFPGGANSPAAFWDLLQAGRDAVSVVPPQRWDAEAFLAAHPSTPGRIVSRHGGFVDDLESFDPAFFGISPREATRMDPQHRLLLEVAWETLDAAGQTPDRRAGRNTGVFVGITGAEYASLQISATGTQELDTYHLTGNALNTAAGRLAFVFGLQGPALAIDTACSSSLTAVHLACQSLRRRECDSALALGVNALLSPIGSIALSRGQVLAPGGRARTFDASAEGMVRGEGCGGVVLKRLSDAQRDNDFILAVIPGSAVNQDGPSSGLTVPHRPAQARLLRTALASAGLHPEAIDYIEAHGTGTPLGDPIEVGALGDVFAGDRGSARPLQMGSVKTNFGHLESAAGIAGLIKTVLALHHEVIPPHLHFSQPSPDIDWCDGRLCVTHQLTPWPRQSRPRIAGVSSFGFSGTNAHVILAEGPTAPPPNHRLAGEPPSYQRQRFPLPPPLEPDSGEAFALPGRLLELPGSDETRFELILHSGNPEWLRDHRVYDQIVFPAAAWFELARRAGATLGQPLLRTGRIHRALTIPDYAKITVHTVITNEGTVQIFSRHGRKGAWILHFEGRLTAAGGAAIPSCPQPTDLPALSTDQLYQNYAERGLAYGPAFRGITALNASPGAVVAQITLPIEAAETTAHRGPHPALLDACFQAAGAAFAADSDPHAVYLPVAVERWEIHDEDADFSAPLNLVAQTTEDGETATVTLHLVDSSDRVIATLEKLELQQATRSALAQQLTSSAPREWLYEITSESAELPAGATIQLEGNWLIVCPSGPPGDALASEIKQAGADTTLTAEFVDGDWTGVVVLSGFETELESPDGVAATSPVLATLQALGRAATTPDFWIITPPPTERPLAAAIWGLGRVAQAEWPHLPTRLLGVEASDPISIVPELAQPTRENQIIKRGQDRHVLRLQSLPWGNQPPLVVAADRTYLITGGRGALGLLTAEWLIDRGARHLVLVGRTPPSPETVAMLDQWSQAGVTITLPAVDLSDATATRTLVAELATAEQKLAGIFHLAGVIEDAALAAQTPQHFQHTANPKSVAAHHLDQALRDKEISLDFWINFSSSAGVLGTPGQANYAAANAWLDAFRGPAERTLNIAWGPWSAGLGAAVGDRYAAHGISSIKPAQAFDLLEQAFISGGAAVAVLPIAWPRFFATKFPEENPPILDRVRPANLKPTRTKPAAAIRTGPAGGAEPVRREIARVMRLEAERLDDALPLNLQGLDSLMAMELRHAIQRVTDRDLPLSTFLGDTPLGELIDLAAAAEPVADHGPTKGENSAVLSRGQSALWFLHQSDPSGAAYHTAFALRLHGKVDVGRLRRVFTQLVERHSQLRARFPRHEGIPRTAINPNPTFPFEIVDAAGFSAAELQTRVAADYAQPFDLERDSLVRLHLYQNSGTEETVLLCTIHHIVSDAWTNWLILDEFRQLYPNAASLAPPTATYADFVRWQENYLAGPDAAAAWTFWQRTLAGPLPTLELPVNFPRPQTLTARGASVPLQISSTRFAEVKNLAQAQGTTAFNLLLTAWQVWLHRHTGQDDIIVGSPTAGRSQAEFTHVAGYFVNPIPFRASIDSCAPFTALLQRNRGHQLAALAHADFPLPLLIERLKLRRDPTRSALFQNLFVYQKPQQGDDGPQSGPQACGDLMIEEFPLAQMEGQFELTLEIFEGGGGTLKYNTALFSSATAQRFVTRFQELLKSITRMPTTAIGQLNLLDDAERTCVTTTWQPPEPALSCETTLTDLLCRQAELTPERPAVTLDDTTLTYAQLFARARELAGALQADRVGPDVLVGVCAERSIELVVALVGIELAGGAYVPFDPSYPPERLEFMYEDSGVDLILTTSDLTTRWQDRGARVWALDQPLPVSGSYAQPDLNPDHAAYLIYTSGSTGRPKGALNIHRAIVNRLQWMQTSYPLGIEDVVLQKTPFSFDVSVWEFFWPLLQGARLVLARPGGQQDSAYLLDLIRRENVSTLHFVPSMLQLFVEVPGLADSPSLRRIICSGEALPAELPARLFASHPTVELHNLYGPTEAAVDVTQWACERDAPPGPIPIGRPVARTPLYVLDAHRNPQPVGVPGELHIGGVQLMRGYHRRPELNAEKLIADPFADDPSARLYRTGDLVSWRPDGVLDYHGRMDHQVKLRGFRIELGEIESSLIARPEIRDAVVLLREDRTDDPQLTAYLIHEDPTTQPNLTNLRSELREYLPDYMVPGAFVTVLSWPLSPNGKLDRAALPAPATLTAPDATKIGARSSPLESLLATHWSDLLGHQNFGLEDNFFDLGGHSLHLGRLHAKLQTEGHTDLELVELFQYPTIRALAARLEVKTSPTSTTAVVVETGTERRAPRRENLAQQRARRRESRPRP